MTLTELLDELRANKLRDNSALDQLWSDATLTRYLNQGYQIFARKTLCIIDKTTTAATQILLADGVSTYALHKSVIAVLSARYEGDETDLPLVVHHAIDDYVVRNSFRPGIPFLSASSPGRPQAWSTDEALKPTKLLRVWPTPAAGEVGKAIDMRVCRLPITLLSTGAPNVGPDDLPEEWHLTLTEWAAYMALRNRDVDGYAPEDALRFRAAFEDDVRQAAQDVKRLMMPDFRYAFGTGGFSWN